MEPLYHPSPPALFPLHSRLQIQILQILRQLPHQALLILLPEKLHQVFPGVHFKFWSYLGKRLKTFLELVQEEEFGGGVVPEGKCFGKLARLAGTQGEGGAYLAIW
jgi:hypothetical protein